MKFYLSSIISNVLVRHMTVSDRKVDGPHICVVNSEIVEDGPHIAICLVNGGAMFFGRKHYFKKIF